MAYVIQHSFVDPTEVATYRGEVLVLDFEFQGIPGLLVPLRETLEFWANQNGRLIELFIWQDSDPLLDKWRVYMQAHGTPILALATALPVLITALKWLIIAFITWTVSRVIFRDSGPTPGQEILKGFTPEQLAGLTPEQIAALIAKPEGGLLDQLGDLGKLALIAFGMYLASKFVGTLQGEKQRRAD